MQAKRTWIALAPFLLFFGIFAGLARAGGSDDALRLVVLHTNDVHGQCRARDARWLSTTPTPRIGGLPRVAAYVAKVRAELDGSNAGLLVLDAGDWFQGTPEGLLDGGEAFTTALVAVGYDALVVGNHEFDHGVAHLAQLIDKTKIPCVLANVHERESGERVGWSPPWRVFERGGLRVGVVGLLTPDTPSITHKDARALDFRDPIAALTAARAELAGEKLDLLIPLTHLGLDDDRLLAEAHSDLPLIIGGHSHTYLRDGVMVGECLICQVGSKASAVGRVELFFDAETHELLRRTYEVVDLLEAPQSPRNVQVITLVEDMLRRSEKEMSEPIGTLLAPLDRSRDRLTSSSAGNLITDMLRAHMDAQVAIQNRGGIRTNLPAGTLTRRDAFELLPFGNHPVLFELTGAQLAAVVEIAVGGAAHSGIEFSGMLVTVRALDDGLAALESITIDGKQVKPDDRIRVVTNDFLAGGGDGYFSEIDAKVLREDPILMREIFEEGLRASGEIEPNAENRYRKTTDR